MKTKLVSMFAVTVMSVGLSITSAQIPSAPTPTVVTTVSVPTVSAPDLPMITSSAKLREYALSQATEVNAGMYSPGMSSSGYDSRTWVGEKSQEGILAMLSQLSLKGDTVSTTDKVGVYVNVSSKDGAQLFYGYNEAAPAQVGGIWSLPSSIGNVVLKMNTVPIDMGRAISYARIIAKDQNGNSMYFDVAYSGQKIYFPPISAGLKDASLRVNFLDGTVVSWVISEGKVMPTYGLSATVSAKFADAYTFKDPSIVTVSVKSDRGLGIVPLIEVNMTFSNNVVFDVVTTEGKRPARFWVKPLNGTTWLPTTGAATGTTVVPIALGTSDVVPEWLPGDFTEPSVPISNNGGGKG